MAQANETDKDKKAAGKDKDAKARDQALQAAVTQIEREFGAGSLMKLGDKTAVEIEAIPTGALSLDLALGVGGVPKGRIVEIFGPESSGKTTLIYHILAQAQAQGPARDLAQAPAPDRAPAAPSSFWPSSARPACQWPRPH